MTPGAGRTRRELAIVVVGCAVAAGVVLLAASRGWPAPGSGSAGSVPPGSPSGVRDAGGAGAPWLSALGLVALAGAGALVAVRGVARRVVGGLLAACGTGIVVTAVTGLVTGRPPGWALAAGVAGTGIAVAGGYALRRGAAWPAMGSRFDRAVTPASGTTPAVTRRGAGAGPATEMWDAIDRGEDPTR